MHDTQYTGPLYSYVLDGCEIATQDDEGWIYLHFPHKTIGPLTHEEADAIIDEFEMELSNHG